jgi:hypothetical protein
VNGAELIKQPEFREWLAGELRRSIRASTIAVIHQPDEASRAFARQVLRYCPKGCRVLSADDLGRERFDSNAVVVCSAVIGGGSRLRKISRDLRDIHAGHRLYLIGYQVSAMRTEAEALAADLRFAGDFMHQVCKFGNLAIGKELHAGFTSERDSLFHGKVGTLPKGVQSRANRLGSAVSLGAGVLWPKATASSQSMTLRRGFAFWRNVPPKVDCVAEAIATVAALLQRAREDEKLSDSNRLASDRFRHVLLHPENFARYNDGVLQAALLRAASGAELDYRTDRDSSVFIKDLILRLESRSGQPAGEALLEFLVALATKRLQIKRSLLEELVKQLRASRISPTGKKCVEYLAAIIVESGDSLADTPFV